MSTQHTIADYLNNHTFQYWLNENFDCDEIQNLLDSVADDGVYPEQFVQWCYDALAFDTEHTMYPIQATACGLHNIIEEEEEIVAGADNCDDHEFHFQEVPLHDDEYFNVPI